MISNIYSFRNLISKTIAPIIVNAQDKEDVVNEVFYKAISKADSYNPELSAPATWLMKIASNTAFDFVRKASNKYEKSVFSEDVTYASCFNNGILHIEYYDTACQIETSIKNLNERDQIVVRSFYFKRMRHCEIAELIGVKTNAVGMIIKRCNEKLKKDFSQRGLSERDF
jgi:RNA polymerase sigma-70 factor (ECF subfamily)